VDVTSETSARKTSCDRGITLPKKPTGTWSVGPGLRGAVWEWRHRTQDGPRIRISAVQAQPGVARLTPMARLPLMIDPGTVVRDKGVAAAINGDFFDTMRFGDAVPKGAVIVNGKPLFMPKGWSAVLVWNSMSRPRTTHVTLAAQVVMNGTNASVVSLNDPLVTGKDISIMTDDWHRNEVPDGLAAVVIKSGQVVKVHARSREVRIPTDGFVLIAKDVSALPAATAGDAATVSVAVKASDHQQVVHAAGHGGIGMKRGVVTAPCSRYESLPRPRSAVAWNADGQIWFLASSSGRRDQGDGMRHGGSTKAELARVARQLGADTAVILDGGGSTALFAKTGATPRRLDMPKGSWVRPVPVVWLMKVA
jgi:hypothetical protein